MISAGRVLLMPKGAYDPSTTYEMLDIVSYNGSSYIAKGTTTGNLPTNTTYWQLSAYGGQAANIAGNFAEIETSSVATSVHYENDIFIDENSQLMKATQTINVGDTIDENVNCTPTTVEALISYLSSYVDSLDSLNKKIQGAIEIAVQTDLHSLAIGEYYKKQTTFYVTNAPTGINQEASATFRLTVEAALDNASQASSPLLITLRTPDGKVYTQGFDGTNWGAWEQIAVESSVSDLVSEIQTLTNKLNNEAATRSVMGAKNRLPLTLEEIKSLNTNGTWASNVFSRNGIDYTINTDALGYVVSIGASGIATGAAGLSLLANDGNLAVNEFAGMTLNGCPSGGGNDTFRIVAATSDVQTASSGFTSATDSGNGATIPSKSYIRIYIVVSSGTDLSTPVTFYPMIRLATDTDTTYQPYAKTNKELTDDVDAIASKVKTKATIMGTGGWAHTATLSCDLNSGALAYLFTEAGILKCSTAANAISAKPLDDGLFGGYFASSGSGLTKDVTAWTDAEHTISRNSIWFLMPLVGNWTLTTS